MLKRVELQEAKRGLDYVCFDAEFQIMVHPKQRYQQENGYRKRELREKSFFKLRRRKCHQGTSSPILIRNTQSQTWNEGLASFPLNKKFLTETSGRE
jgi:hypothetical protein